MSTKPVASQVVPGENGAESATASEGAIRRRDSWFHWCGTADAISQTNERAERRSLLAAYFSAVAVETVAPAARYFSGAFFAPAEAGPSSRIDRAVIAAAIQDVGRIGPADFEERYGADHALGETAGEVLAGRLPSGISVRDVSAWGEELTLATDARRHRELLRDILARLGAIEAQYLVRLIDGSSLRVDKAEIEQAVAKRRSRRHNDTRR